MEDQNKKELINFDMINNINDSKVSLSPKAMTTQKISY